jgi:hypothetical protein
VSFFVPIYNRSAQALEELREFAEGDRASAETFRMNAQRRALRDNLDEEIILFRADSRGALERTHGSYFLTERELLERVKEAAEAS